MARQMIFLLVTVTLAFGWNATAFAQDLKISHLRPPGATVDDDLKAFARTLEETTGGDVRLKIFPASALGDYTVVQERVALGDVDMAVQPIATGVDPRMQVVSLPYLAESWEAARRIYGPDGPMRRTTKALYAEQGITLLAAYPVYFGGVSLNRVAVAPGDVGIAKGIKVRAPGIKSFQLTAAALGYVPVPIPFADAVTAVRTGVVDGVFGSGAEGYYASFRDVTKSYIPMNTHFEVWYLIINSDRFAGLAAADREALLAAAQDFEAKRWTRAEAAQAENERKLAEAGVRIYGVSATQRSAASAKVRRKVWPEILRDIGEVWARGVLKDVLGEGGGFPVSASSSEVRR